MKTLPIVSVVMPVYNEEKFIERSLMGVVEQDYPQDRLEILVADGRSSDRTREIIERFGRSNERVHLVDNPGRTVSKGLNQALRKAQGDVVVRVDGHCGYPLNYISRLVKLLEETGAASVGGTLIPVGNNYVSRAIASAYYSRVGVGPSMRGEAGSLAPQSVDSVHGGCWRRDTLIAAGMFDEEMVRNQDDEMSFRLRKAGGKIVRDPLIRFEYSVRDSYARLFKQFLQYGFWKVRVLQKHPLQGSFRHFLPAFFVTSLLLLAVLIPFFASALPSFVFLLLSYLGAIIFVSASVSLRMGLTLWPGTALALVAMHFGYGSGFILGALHWVIGMKTRAGAFETITR